MVLPIRLGLNDATLGFGLARIDQPLGTRRKGDSLPAKAFTSADTNRGAAPIPHPVIWTAY